MAAGGPQVETPLLVQQTGPTGAWIVRLETELDLEPHLQQIGEWAHAERERLDAEKERALYERLKSKFEPQD